MRTMTLGNTDSVVAKFKNTLKKKCLLIKHLNISILDNEGKILMHYGMLNENQSSYFKIIPIYFIFG